MFSDTKICSSPESLTEVEVIGLASDVNLADGHAYQDLADPYQPIVANLPAIWRKASETDIPLLEKEFMKEYGTLMKSSVLPAYPHFSICPTASNSIDIVGAWLRSKSLKVALIEPTFDNLALLLRRREVELVSISESQLDDMDLLFSHLIAHHIGALFLVNPNNPSGKYLGERLISELAQRCAQNRIVLVFDRTFRLFVNDFIDDYNILIGSGVTFLSIEDTGKTWPTLDMKASALLYSSDVAREIKTIYQEVYLSTSAFTLAILTEFFKATTRDSLSSTLWDLVRVRRNQLRETIRGSFLEIPAENISSSLGVEWINISKSGLTDLEVATRFQRSSVTVLPGRHFFWNNNENPENHNFIRIAMMKPQSMFAVGIDRLRNLVESGQ